jgi:putative nucleotidyltransferase with HDIG domain
MNSAPRGIELRRQQAEDRLARLAGLSPYVVQLLSTDPRSDAFPARVQALVERERPLASHVLALANNAGSARSDPVLTLPQAIARVGTRRITRLIAARAFLRAFPADAEPAISLWRHALLVATASREIARVAGRAADPDEAFVGGLLHDIGRFVLATEDATELGLPEEEGWDGQQRMLASEQELCGQDHPTVGERICRSWDLPDNLVLIVRWHHAEPTAEMDLNRQQHDTLRILQQADRLAALLRVHPQLEELPASDRLAILGRCCVHPDWDWAPAGATHLDLLVGPVLSRGAEWAAEVGLEAS